MQWYWHQQQHYKQHSQRGPFYGQQSRANEESMDFPHDMVSFHTCYFRQLAWTEKLKKSLDLATTQEDMVSPFPRFYAEGQVWNSTNCECRTVDLQVSMNIEHGTASASMFNSYTKHMACCPVYCRRTVDC